MKRKPKERESFKLPRLLAREISAQSFAPPPPAYVSDLFVTPPRPFCAFCIYHPVVKVSLFQQYKQEGLQILVLSDRRNEFKWFKSIGIICLSLSFVFWSALKPLSHLINLFLSGNIEICRLRQRSNF